MKYFTFILCNTSQTFAREKFDFWTKNIDDGFQIVDNILKRNRFRMLYLFSVIEDVLSFSQKRGFAGTLM
ncbi:hypothetical protein EJC52_16740 [Bacillus velezensis]|nr:hypothetical protein CXB71_01650 [Bacillus velezensis]TCJ49393.1 hypothetical protein EJC52_16740 [Bacillus velezensis]